VALEDVPALYARLEAAHVVGRSACGHTIRNVLACPEAATSADEPFDVSVDARWLSSQLVARSSELNVALPNRLNISLGGCTQCGIEALTNDIGLVACVQDGEPGYQLWAGGSLGTAPRLSLMLRPFLPRADLWPAVWSIVEWFLTEGDVEQVSKGRLKFLVESRGESVFRAAFTKRFTAMRAGNALVPPPVAVAPPDDLVRTLAQAPALGWRHTIRPERRAGYASVTVRVPLGDLRADDLVALSEIATNGRIVLTRDQNVLVPSVPVDDVSRVVGELGARDLGPEGALGAADVRACPGLSFCSLAITGSQPVAMAVERAMNVRQDLPRDVVVSVSGCPNSCTKQQVADIGLSGTKVKVKGVVGLGYQLWLGADLPRGLVGEPVLRLTEDEVPAAVIATTELWVALRRPGETPGSTFRRTGLDVVADALEVRLREFGFGERPLLDEVLVGAA
jgi:sulfite reductase beta subunit-like hemoprotein